MLVLEYLISLVVLVVGFRIVWESCVVIDERNKLRRYTGKYYDFDIDQALEAMGKTRSQALSEIKNPTGTFDKNNVKYRDGDNT